jgi:hypothetical protein
MIASTALVSTTISGICRAFDKTGEKNINVKSIDKQENDQFKQASAEI